VAESGSGGRRLLVVLAVILGVLVLVCAGVISYMLSLRNNDGGSSGTGSMGPIGKVTTALHLPVGGTEAAIAPYRLGERILHIGMTSEGMLTR
jgi:serine/threonine-protein kinase